ncbi:MAG: hypothetical protein PHC61_01565 [Chitinivibrionales bacterium]|nr:hypothetical protein [Chitinivibrionales bacterium]
MRHYSCVLTVLIFILGLSSISHAAQVTFIDQTLTWTAGYNVQPTQIGLTNLVSPVDYRNGTVYLRYEVIDKPSDKLIGIQLCMWQDAFVLENCSYCQSYSTKGVYYWNLGTFSGFWMKNGTSIDFTRPFGQVTIIHKDGSCTGQLMQSSGCGAACYPGNDLNQHVPITFKATAIVVAPGSTLDPPSSWTGCPAGWGCGNGTAVTEQIPVSAVNSIKANLNPVKRSITIKTTGEARSITSVRVIDYSGACVALFKPDGRDGSFAATGPVIFVRGAYLVQLTGNGFARSGKLAISY